MKREELEALRAKVSCEAVLEQAGYGLDAPMPDFDQAGAEPGLRQALRERLDELLDAPLRTRQVLMDLQRY